MKTKTRERRKVLDLTVIWGLPMFLAFLAGFMIAPGRETCMDCVVGPALLLEAVVMLAVNIKDIRDEA